MTTWTKKPEKTDQVTQFQNTSSFLETRKSYGTNQYHFLANGNDSLQNEDAYPNEERNETNEKGDVSPIARISTLQACWNVLNLIQGR